MTRVDPVPLQALDGVVLGWWRVSDPDIEQADARHCLLIHGTFSDRRVCMSMAQQWAQRGHVAWVLEWRSHGSSAAAPAPFDFEDVALRDVTAALAWWQANHWSLASFTPSHSSSPSITRPPALVAATHSGGGLVLLMALLRQPQWQALVQRMALFACQSHLAGVTLANRAYLRCANAASRWAGGIPGRVLRLGVCDETHTTMSSWFSWNLQRTFTGKDGFDYGARLSALPQAVLCLAAESDRWIAPVPAVRQFAQLFSNPHSRFQLCGPGAGHHHRFGHANLMHGHAARQAILPGVVEWLLEGTVDTDAEVQSRP